MTIQWYGQGCVKLQTKELTIIVDPFDPKATGLRLPRTTPQILLLTKRGAGTPPLPGLREETFTVDGPGEYESRGVTMHGVGAPAPGNGEQTLYLLELEGMRVGHLGPLSSLLTDLQLETLEGVDILFVPVGGKSVLSAKQASEVISRVEPRIVTPIYYAIPGRKIPLDALSVFLREVGVKSTEPTPTLRLTPKDLPQEETRFAFLALS